MADSLPDLSMVTLCAVTSTAIELTIDALRKSARQCSFGAIKLFTDQAPAERHDDIEIVPIDHVGSAEDYSSFILKDLHRHIDTSHLMVVQWDGYVVDGTQWLAEFLDYDFIGAVWPQFSDAHIVGNGGFSLRSKALMALSAGMDATPHIAEDIQICRLWRDRLEQEHGMRFAPPALARRFSVEREEWSQPSFGFHGIFNVALLFGEAALQDMLRGVPAGLIKPAEYRATIVDLLSRRRFRAAKAVASKALEGFSSPAMHFRLATGVLKDLVRYRQRFPQGGLKNNHER